MDCPKCTGTLEKKTYGRKITVHRCSDCKGLWCKADVLLEMRKEWMAEVILDSGDPKVGQEYNALDDIDCPECGERMDKTADEKQIHIWYESCPNGHGMFFDAGEFTDLKYETFMDRIKGAIVGKRPSD